MTPGLAKRIVLPILERWSRKTIWSVRWKAFDGQTECRWFKKEELAGMFAALQPGAVIDRHTVTGDDHPTCQEEIAIYAPYIPLMMTPPYDPNNR